MRSCVHIVGMLSWPLRRRWWCPVLERKTHNESATVIANYQPGPALGCKGSDNLGKFQGDIMHKRYPKVKI